MPTANQEIDLFISYAGEDSSFVNVLTRELDNQKIRFWHDKSRMAAGNSIPEHIDHAISISRFGLTIFSPHYFEKYWTKKELDAFIARESIEDIELIIPIRLQISQEDISKKRPMLANKISIDASINSIKSIVKKIKTRLTHPTNYSSPDSNPIYRIINKLSKHEIIDLHESEIIHILDKIESLERNSNSSLPTALWLAVYLESNEYISIPRYYNDSFPGKIKKLGRLTISEKQAITKIRFYNIKAKILINTLGNNT